MSENTNGSRVVTAPSSHGASCRVIPDGLEDSADLSGFRDWVSSPCWLTGCPPTVGQHAPRLRGLRSLPGSAQFLSAVLGAVRRTGIADRRDARKKPASWLLAPAHWTAPPPGCGTERCIQRDQERYVGRTRAPLDAASSCRSSTGAPPEDSMFPAIGFALTPFARTAPDPRYAGAPPAREQEIR
jgi:hypothetical protein